MTPGRGILLLASALALHAQSAFEVASIRPSDPRNERGGMQFTATGLNVLNTDLYQIIAEAYALQCGKSCRLLITGGPSWMASQRFDILAKAPEGAPPGREQTRERLRALLASRFQLAVREESKDMPAFALVVAANGPKFEESRREDSNGGIRGARGQMIGENAPLQMLVVNLAGALGRPVIDRTGLKGRYNFTLEYSTESATPVPSDAPPLVTALQEQLGLKVEPVKTPVKTIVVERVEQPSAN